MPRSPSNDAILCGFGFDSVTEYVHQSL
jgi:hypothetical protein